MNTPAPVLNDGIFVIFGITGDLAKRKLLPALYHLAHMNLLAPDFKIVGTTRRETTIDDVIEAIRESVNDDSEEATLATLRGMIHMVHMDIGKEQDYGLLRTELESIEAAGSKKLNRLYYLAVPPEMFEAVVGGLGTSGLNHGSCEYTESRLLIEKPFGSDTNSALELIRKVETVFDEAAIYRVDHYLAKETAQNILTFRMSNPIFRAVWDRQSIDHIIVTAYEKIGIEGRVNFYEKTGALRDLIQSHLIQLLALITMEEPRDRTAHAIHASKLGLLHDIEPVTAEQVDARTVRGQYESYTKEVNNPASHTETYAAVHLSINNDRWRDVPILLQTGKAMHKKMTSITIAFKSREVSSPDNNILTLNIQPNEGIELSLRAKKPSLNDETQTVNMDFDYSSSFAGAQPDAYERVLVDAIRGDKTLFTTDEEVLASWRIIQAILDQWQSNNTSMETYPSGSLGPSGVSELAHNIGACLDSDTSCA